MHIGVLLLDSEGDRFRFVSECLNKELKIDISAMQRKIQKKN